MLFDKVKEVIVETINCAEESVVPTATFKDLEVDSLDAVELMMALEEAFEITIADEEIANFKNVQDIVNFIEAHAQQD